MEDWSDDDFTLNPDPPNDKNDKNDENDESDVDESLAAMYGQRPGVTGSEPPQDTAEPASERTAVQQPRTQGQPSHYQKFEQLVKARAYTPDSSDDGDVGSSFQTYVPQVNQPLPPDAQTVLPPPPAQPPTSRLKKPNGYSMSQRLVEIHGVSLANTELLILLVEDDGSAKLVDLKKALNEKFEDIEFDGPIKGIECDHPHFRELVDQSHRSFNAESVFFKHIRSIPFTPPVDHANGLVFYKKGTNGAVFKKLVDTTDPERAWSVWANLVVLRATHKSTKQKVKHIFLTLAQDDRYGESELPIGKVSRAVREFDEKCSSNVSWLLDVSTNLAGVKNILGNKCDFTMPSVASELKRTLGRSSKAAASSAPVAPPTRLFASEPPDASAIVKSFRSPAQQKLAEKAEREKQKASATKTSKKKNGQNTANRATNPPNPSVSQSKLSFPGQPPAPAPPAQPPQTAERNGVDHVDDNEDVADAGGGGGRAEEEEREGEEEEEGSEENASTAIVRSLVPRGSSSSTAIKRKQVDETAEAENEEERWIEMMRRVKPKLMSYENGTFTLAFQSKDASLHSSPHGWNLLEGRLS